MIKNYSTFSVICAAAVLAAGPVFATQGRAAVPLEFVDSMFGAGTMTASCLIEGSSIPCKLDSGANMSSVWSDTILSSEASMGSAYYRTASGASVRCDLVMAKMFAIGTSAGENMELARCPSQDGRSNAILGLDALAKDAVYLDSRRKELVLSPVIGPGKITHSFSTDPMGHVLLPILFKRNGDLPLTPSTAFWDTGAAITMVSLEFIKAHPELYTLLNGALAVSNTAGQVLPSTLMMAKNFELGGKMVVAPYVIATDFKAIHEMAGPSVDFILGYNVVRELNWYVDFKDYKWFAE